VVIPVVLMLGSVYTHAVAGDLQDRAGQLQEARRLAEAENQRLGLRVERLTAPGRITSLARERLNMRQPGEGMKVYGESVEGGNEESR
jgi:cell division protein FtsL